ncbi:MAG: SCP2 sterol-binding domain-containing protein [Cyclobacteriaceae bacterium]|nr:SCP2 sterol-binding domain-containing protein [Cyclobacteriaceae bacterium]
MTLKEAKEKVSAMAASHGGKLYAKVNFVFGDGTIHLDDTVSPTRVEDKELPADCALKMSLEDFGKLLSGDLNPMMAFMSGKMKVDGDKSIALKLASLF